jgi:predicted cupin superfamily sugar epimerase
VNSEAAAIIEALGLKPHPTCGFVSETYRGTDIVPQDGLPAGFHGPRPLGSVLYFMVTPEAHIALHRIRNDQMYHHYRGDRLEVLLLYPDGSGAVRTIGGDIAAGEPPQLFIPGGTFHMSRLQAGGAWALLGTSEWPAVEPPDVEQAEPAELIAAFPAMRAAILSFAGALPGRPVVPAARA